MYSIGEFSRITGLTIKTLRFYHEQGLLIPAHIDDQSGYRFYDECQIEVARTIAYLRTLEFSLSEIKTLLAERENDEQILQTLQRQKTSLAARVAHYKKTIRLLDQFISEERRVNLMSQVDFEIREKMLDAVKIAAIHMKGHYSDCGKAFGKICRTFGRHVSGKPFLLHHDSDYKETDADFEACVPIRQGRENGEISVRDIPAGKCVSLMHKGPYEQLGRSYARVLKHVKDHGYAIVMPTREIYIKGPGMIFRGNPQNYVTEIQIPIENAAEKE